MIDPNDNRQIVRHRSTAIAISDSTLARRGLELLREARVNPIAALGEPITAQNVWRLRMIAEFGGTERIACLDISPDNSCVVAGLDNGEIQLWRISDGSRQKAFRGNNEGVDQVRFSPKGGLVASSTNGEVILWQLPDGRLIKRLTSLGDNWVSIAFSPDGSIFATAPHIESSVSLWTTEGAITCKVLGVAVEAVKYLIFHPTEPQVAISSSDGNIYLWDFESDELCRTLTNAGDTPHHDSVAYSPDGSILAAPTLRHGSGLALLDTTSGELLRIVSPGPWLYCPGDVAFSPDGSVLATVDTDFHLWSPSDGALLLKPEGRDLGYPDWPSSLRFSLDGRLLAVAWHDHVLIWSVSPLS